MTKRFPISAHWLRVKQKKTATERVKHEDQPQTSVRRRSGKDVQQESDEAAILLTVQLLTRMLHPKQRTVNRGE